MTKSPPLAETRHQRLHIDIMEFFNELAKPFYLEGENQKGILLIHGFTGSPAKLRPLGKFLNEKGGYTVNAVLLRGHGTVSGELEKTSWRDWIADTAEGYRKLKESCHTTFVIGFSMGGLLSLILAEDEKTDKIVTIAAGLLARDKREKFVPILKYFIKTGKWADFKKTFPAEADNYLLEYNIGYETFPVKSVENILKLKKIAKKGFKKIHCPALIIQSKKDDIVRPESAKLIYKNIGSSRKKLLWLEQSRHICTLGPERDLIYNNILSFLND